MTSQPGGERGAAGSGPLAAAFVRKWWVLLLNGIAAILFGVMAWAWPGVTLLALVALFGAFCLVEGMIAVFAALSHEEKVKPWGHMLGLGIVSIIAGIVAFVWPGHTAVAVLVIIALWAIIRGILQIVAAVELRKILNNEWLLVLAGILSILFGLVLIARPGAGALALIWLIGVFAVVHGILLVTLSFKLRGLHRTLAGPR